MTAIVTRRRLLGAATLLAMSTALTAPGFAQDKTTLTFLTSQSSDVVKITENLVKRFEEANPDIDIVLETRPGGSEGDNIIKTRLATGEMADLFQYNSGALFQSLSPQRNLVPLTAEPFQADVLDVFKSVVSSDGEVYGVPMQTAMGGGVLYNRNVYEELGLEIPKTWDEFIANSEKAKEAGKIGVVQSFGTTWTSQVFFLANYYNVQAAEPDFAEKFTAGELKFATDPNAIKGFERQADVLARGLVNEDYAATTWTQGQGLIANGDAAHYPMLTSAIPAIRADYPDGLNNVGFFALPGDSAEQNGLTTWMPAAIYVPNTTSNLDAVKRFLAFVASVDGCNAAIEAVPPAGPFMVNGCALPDDVPPSVKDLLAYFDAGNITPALEFVSPVKGPSLEQITVEVGLGSRTPAEGAALYDEDVRKQAQQLGLAGW